jgi:transcriptional regulator
MKIESAFDIIFDPNFKESNEDGLKVPHLLIEDFIYENLACS